MHSWKKLLIPICLAFLLLLTGALAANAENDYPYTAQASYGGSTVTGTLTPRAGYQGTDDICIVAFFYIAGGYYMETTSITTDNTIEIGAVGPIEYIALTFATVDNPGVAVAAPIEIYYNHTAAQGIFAPAVSASYQDGVLTVYASFKPGDTRPYKIIVDGQETGRALDISNPSIGISRQLQAGNHVISIYNPYANITCSASLTVQSTSTPPPATDPPAAPPSGDVPSGVIASYQDGVLTVTAKGDWNMRPYSILVDGADTNRAVSPYSKTNSFSIALANGTHVVTLHHDLYGDAASAMFTVVSVAPTDPPALRYTITAAYDGKTLTGRLTHDASIQDAADITIRATFFLEGSYYTAAMAAVEADGSFSIAASGPIAYITVTAFGSPAADPSSFVRIVDPIELYISAQTSFGALTGALPQNITPPSGVSLDFTASYTDGDLNLSVTTDSVCELFIDGQATGKAVFTGGEYHFPFTLANGQHTVTLYAPRHDKSVRKILTVDVPDYWLTVETEPVEISPSHAQAFLRVHVHKNQAINWPADEIVLNAQTSDAALLSVSQAVFVEKLDSGREKVFFVTLTPAETGVGVAQVNCSMALDPSVSVSCTVIVHDTSPSVLPSSLNTLEAEALSGIAAREIQLPDGCAAIGARAFASCASLSLVVIGEGLASIAPDAFAGCPDVRVVCPESAASLILNSTGIQPVVH